MRRRHDALFELSYLKNKYARTIIVSVFVAFNIVMLVMYALPKVPGQVPRYFWPICTAIVAIFAVTYWFILQALRAKLGEVLGLVLHVYEADGKEVPPSMENAMEDARRDGTRRRTRVEVCILHVLQNKD